MDNRKCKKLVAPIMVTAALIMTVILPGFASADSTSKVSSARQYQQKVYFIGEIKDFTSSITGSISVVKEPADATKQVFVNPSAYDGVSADAPIFIAADQLMSMSVTIKQGLLATYRNSHPIILINGQEAEINALLGILNRVQNYQLPTNCPYAELFAVSEGVAGNFSFSVYPPFSSNLTSTQGAPVTDDSSGKLTRSEMLLDWVNKRGTRTNSMNSVKQALAANNIDSSDLTELVKAEHHEEHFIQAEEYGLNAYSLIYTMYPFHQFNASDGKEYDWLYVEQEGVLSAEPRYEKFGGVRVANEAEERKYCGEFCTPQREIVYSIGDYRISNKIVDTTVKYGLQGGSSPSTTNEKTTTKSGVKFDLAGDFGLKSSFKITEEGGEAGGEGSISVKGAVSISTEKTFDTYDCTVENVSTNNAPAWKYEFSPVEQYGWWIVQEKLKEPVKLSRSTFQPTHKWIWRFSPEVRETVQNFETTIDVGNLTTLSSYAILWAAVTEPYTFNETVSFSGKPPLYFAPVIVAPSKNLTFDAKAHFNTMEVSVGRNWSAACDQDWCQAVPTTGKGDNPQFSITVSPNTTGKERKATITFLTYDYKGTIADKKYKQDKMYVTQSMF